MISPGGRACAAAWSRSSPRSPARWRRPPPTSACRLRPGGASRRGLWLDARKPAACGLHLRRQVANHGWAFDVATPRRDRGSSSCRAGSPPATVVSLDRPRGGRGGDGAAPPVAEVAARLGPALAARWS
ncbi:MAG: hypothetical protein HS111_36035 [Kofleriaceae bacterium]|nr:hypothetical protein [Kofleriaceae bacterium]